ncbi:hypothetical protein F2P81_022413 [Scophthalmus maximus]|uniref:Kazal-like domain-containing protein n=1 Tax=Scophthalmus maximus TaxID=52904 RepID=A0A6A4S2H7_SCOMX|nr:hypothetical protein F2P81_022413 [Scophthalmus maximus]
MEDEQWLSTISQYSRKLKHWNRFRDAAGYKQSETLPPPLKPQHAELESHNDPATDDYIKNTEENMGSDEKASVEVCSPSPFWFYVIRLAQCTAHSAAATRFVRGRTVTAVDTTKDPCQNVKCSRHKVCVAQGYQRAMCVNRKKLEHRVKQSEHLEARESGCKPCPVAASSPVCGSDGHNYASEARTRKWKVAVSSF